MRWTARFEGLPAALPRRAGAGRPRPASAVRKIVAAHTLATLDAAASRDALGRQMSGGIIAGGDLGIYADHRARTRREESPRRFSCFAVRGPLQTAAAVQHRHVAGGQRRAKSTNVKSPISDPAQTSLAGCMRFVKEGGQNGTAQ